MHKIQGLSKRYEQPIYAPQNNFTLTCKQQKVVSDHSKKLSVTIVRDIRENTLNLEDIHSSPEESERIYSPCKSLKSLSSVELWPLAELHSQSHSVTNYHTGKQFHTQLISGCRKAIPLAVFT